MKKWIIATAVVGLVGAGLYRWRNPPAEAAADGESAATQTAKVERGDLVSSVASTGKVISNQDVDIKAKASGQVVELPYDISDQVKRGDLLLRLDPVDEQRKVDQAQVQLDASQAKLAQARQNLIVAQRTLVTARQRAEAQLAMAQARASDAQSRARRMQQLLDQKLASQEDYDTAATLAAANQAELKTAQAQIEDLKTQEVALELKRQDVKLAEAQVTNDQLALADARRRLEETRVVAPIDGVVATRPVQLGTIVSSAVTNVGGGTTLMTLSDLSRVFVLASVDESDIGRVALGQEVKITADAYRERGAIFSGKVVRIATKGVNTSNVVTFEVKIEVLSENKTLLRPEMTANVEIVAGTAQNALLVPADAVVRKGPKRFVTVIRGGDKGGAQEEREVELGISDGVKTVVARGVEEGESVLVHRSEADSRWRSSGLPRGPMMGGGGRR